ncbi:DUF86 domain-containing protein [Chitinophaga sp.]|uniref:HepT-like ribonuclease domain-containing protein n=1 Tax=Chitinophaga sp. TaxID=1869181 RepID=UPI002F91EB25
MKDRSIEKYMYDVIDSINAIQVFTKDATDFDTFVSSRLLTSAIERELQVPDLNISEVQKIKATRNIIVHDYDGINYRILWDIINNHLPILKKEAEAILNHQTYE